MESKVNESSKRKKRSFDWEDFDYFKDFLGYMKQLLIKYKKEYSKLENQLDEERNKSEAETKKMLLQLIYVMDSFEDVFKTVDSKLELKDEQTKNWIETFRVVYKKLQQTVSDYNIEPINTVNGEKVNPEIHKVLDTEKKPGWVDNTITEVVHKGYRWNGKLLRFAEVKAVKNRG